MNIDKKIKDDFESDLTISYEQIGAAHKPDFSLNEQRAYANPFIQTGWSGFLMGIQYAIKNNIVKKEIPVKAEQVAKPAKPAKEGPAKKRATKKNEVKNVGDF